MFRAIISLIGIINKVLLLHLVGCLYYCISDARSYKHVIRASQQILAISDTITLRSAVPNVLNVSRTDVQRNVTNYARIFENLGCDISKNSYSDEVLLPKNNV